jgi:hypothetical protein
LLLHRPDLLAEPQALADTFAALQASGKVRHFGVSHHTAGQIALLQRHLRQPLVVQQVELSLLHHGLLNAGITANQVGHADTQAAGLLDFCQLHGIRVQAWSPLAGGRHDRFSPLSRLLPGGHRGAVTRGVVCPADGRARRARTVGWAHVAGGLGAHDPDSGAAQIRGDPCMAVDAARAQGPASAGVYTFRLRSLYLPALT